MCSLSVLYSFSNLYQAVSFRFASVNRVSRAAAASSSSPHADLLSYIRASLDKLEGTGSDSVIRFDPSDCVVNKVLK